jgi:hypothetical protein
MLDGEPIFAPSSGWRGLRIRDRLAALQKVTAADAAHRLYFARREREALNSAHTRRALRSESLLRISAR